MNLELAIGPLFEELTATFRRVQHWDEAAKLGPASPPHPETSINGPAEGAIGPLGGCRDGPATDARVTVREVPPQLSHRELWVVMKCAES